jgi:hypothetical protein
VAEERRRTPPLVQEIRKVGLALAGAVGMWASADAFLTYRTLKAVEAMRATPDTVYVTDTLTVLENGRQRDYVLPF